MNLTATEIGAACRAWWAASYPNSPPSENEGRILTAEGRRYLVRDGRRLWLDPPPPNWTP